MINLKLRWIWQKRTYWEKSTNYYLDLKCFIPRDYLDSSALWLNSIFSWVFYPLWTSDLKYPIPPFSPPFPHLQCVLCRVFSPQHMQRQVPPVANRYLVRRYLHWIRGILLFMGALQKRDWEFGKTTFSTRKWGNRHMQQGVLN